MAEYLNQEAQKQMVLLINEYMALSNNGNDINFKSNKIMRILFVLYFDKLIMGMIYSPKYNFWKFAEIDDLLQEGRMAVLSSIHKQQWIEERGTIFNFYSSVISKNLINFTKKNNKKWNNLDLDINDVYNDLGIQYHQDYHKAFLIEEAFIFLKHCFSGKQKFENLTDLLYHYYTITEGKKFIKKDFISFAKAYNFSPASVNNYFSYLKRLKSKKELKQILDMEEINEG